MKNRLHRHIEVDGKRVDYQINRRGCKGRWTKKSDRALAAIVAAAARLQVDSPPQSRRRRSRIRRPDHQPRGA